MAKQLVDTTTNNGTHIGDPAKTAFEKVNANFNELYPAALPGTEAERAAARARMGLGTAATLTATTSREDATEGRALRVGDFGIGSQSAPAFTAEDMNLQRPAGFYVAGGQASPFQESASVLHLASSAGYQAQIGVRISGGTDVYVRRLAGGEWLSPVTLLDTGKASALPITGSLSPATDNSVSYGTAARRPTQLFAATATIGTSDAREKTPVRALTEAEYAVGLQLAREIGAYRWLEAVERKGEGAREHFGQTVQRAIEIFQQHGLDPFAYGAICYDTWEQETVEHPAEYEQGALIREAWTEVTLEAGDRYSWRDSELFWLICAAQQRQADELAERQADILARLEALEQAA